MDLRAKITDALIEAQMCADTGQPLTAARYVDAVMGVVEARLGELEAGHHYSDDPWDYGYYQALKDVRGEQ